MKLRLLTICSKVGFWLPFPQIIKINLRVFPKVPAHEHFYSGTAKVV